MGPLHHLLGLADHIHPTHNHGAAQVQARPQCPELLRQLVSQLPGGSNHQSEHPVRVLSQAVEYGERKSGGLAATGLGQAQDVLAGEDSRDAVALYRSGSLDSEFFAGLDGPFSEAQVGEGDVLGSRVVGIGFLPEDGFEVLQGGGGGDGGGNRWGGVNLGGSSFVGFTTAGKQGEVLIHLDVVFHGSLGWAEA